MAQVGVCLDTELRKLRPAELYTLGQILNASDSWKKLMAIVPKEGAPNVPRFNTEHFRMIEQAIQGQRRNAAEIFLDEWSTMGRSRPTLRVLLDLLTKAELFRAADYIAGDILKEQLPKRPEYGPAAAVDISDETLKKLLEEKESISDYSFDESLILGSSAELDGNKIVYPPDVMVDAGDHSSSERNKQSTKLASSGGNFHGKYKEANTDSDKAEESGRATIDVSDLIKFSRSMNISNECDSAFLPACVYAKQEMASQELPAFLKEFGQSIGQAINQELKTDDLPACLNTRLISSSSSNSRNDSDSDSSFALNSNINQNELVSAELPQCVLELGLDASQNRVGSTDRNIIVDKSNINNTLASQELPLTVLEYNR